MRSDAKTNCRSCIPSGVQKTAETWKEGLRFTLQFRPTPASADDVLRRLTIGPTTAREEN
jgi:hypothetical protein